MTVWGSWVKNEWNFRSGINVTQTGVSDDHYTFAVDGYSQSTQSVINYGKSVLQWSESGDPSWHDLGTVYPSGLGYGATAHNISLTDTFTRYYGKTRTAQYRHWFSSPDSSDSAYQAGGYAQVDLTIAARPYAKPRAPKSGRVAYTSDKSVTVGWQADYDGTYDAQPWTGVYVWRSTDGGSWAKVATLGWDKTSWADTTTSANHSYAYQVSSYNPTGESSRTACGTVRTTPAAPAGVSVARTSATAFKVGATSGSNWGNSATKVHVRVAVDGGDWEDVSTALAVGGTVAYSGAANHRYQFACRAWGTSSWGKWAYSSTYYTAPSAPTGAAVARASDTSQRVTWALGTNAAKCWQGIYVQRSVDGGAWASLATLSGTPTNHADGSTAANHRYRYRVAAYNSYATSGWAETGDVYTTPRAPSVVTAAATGPAAVEVSASGLSAIAEAFEVSHRAGATGEWEDAVRASSLPCAMSSVAGENYYRVRALRGSLASAWTESAGVTTVAQPKAPTVTGVQSRYATGLTPEVSWVPNHPDGSAQQAAQVEHTAPDGTATTVDVTGDATSAALPALAKGHHSVRVRTKGAWAEGDGWGEWCDAAEFDAYDLAKVTFTAPAAGAELDRVPVTLSWDAEDETGIAFQTLEVLGPDGFVLHSANLAGDARSYRLDQSTLMPQNRSSYVARLTAWGGSGLSVTVEVAFSTLWSAPDLASCEVSYDGLAAAQLRVSFGAAEGLPETVAVDVERVLADGSSLTLATGMADGETVVDRLPPLNVPYSYRLTAHSEAGSTSVATVAATARCPDAVLSWGTDASRGVRCRYNPSLSHSYSRGVEYLHFADGGASGGLPVAYGLDQRDRATSLSWDVTDFAAADAMARSVYDCWLRLPTGQRCRAGVSWDIDRRAPGLWTVAAKLTETVWEEPSLG